ncbi:MAG: hypothetical protein AAF500_19040 [Myxococcota bacterium]
MNRYSWLLLVGLLTVGVACGDTQGNGTGAVDPTLTCDGNDNLALLWGSFTGRGLLVTEPAAIGIDWVLFSHPTQPLLGFLHPPDWTGQPITLGSGSGVDLVRNDGGGFYHNLTTFDPSGTVPVGQWLDESVVRAFELMGDAGMRSQLCAFPPTTVVTNPGIAQTVSATVVLTEDTVLLSAVSIASFDSVVGNGVNVQSYGGRRAEFNQIADQVLFDIINQLLIGGGDDDRDTDLDGTIDRLDEFPLDPTRQ